MGLFEMIDLTVSEDVSDIFWAAVSHTHRVNTNEDFVFVFQPPQGRIPWGVE